MSAEMGTQNRRGSNTAAQTLCWEPVTFTRLEPQPAQSCTSSAQPQASAHHGSRL
ncbi:hypothetical protein GGTG_06199 [Gaeumannomyces tritici R3-111a-1]|uniref:Uncharacterized protein n=1 Tax=Gaeumannomyces tritici (strain R3-111a-1) TaxID=644352 RepID=J3NY45_GAET3|nr:hypothetical protein GGTG_06199 [Gaeumannomyces tritici R3-111a-1]EJT76278.1 hypothetical protein GGTG_06199 [Gaeumannomyces tritici R3-111a-1]